MNIKLLLRISLRSLQRHKMRSLLTTLGIIIGVTAIITVMSLGEGAKHKVGREIDKLGQNFIIALSKPAKQKMMLGKKFFKQSTLDAILDECEGIKDASPASINNVVATYDGTSQRTNAVGVMPRYFPIREWDVVQGSMFTESDIKSARKVVVLGQTTKKELFGEDIDPIGKTIRIKNIPFKVIGILDAKGTNPGGQDEDDTLFMPLSTFQRKIAGLINKFQAILFSAKSKDTITRTALQISEIIRQQHRLKPGDEDDFTLFTQDDISQATDATFIILNLLLLLNPTKIPSLSIR